MREIACAVSSSEETTKSTSSWPSRHSSTYSTFDVRMTVVAFGASRRANIPATRLASSRDVQAITRSASPTPASARSRRLAPLPSNVDDVEAVGERLKPRRLGVEDGQLVLVVKRLDDRRPDLARADDEDPHGAEAYSGRMPRTTRSYLGADACAVGARARRGSRARGGARSRSGDGGRERLRSRRSSHGLRHPRPRSPTRRASRDACYVVEQTGRVIRSAGGRRTGRSSTCGAEVESGGEQGLLGLAFHPELRDEPALLRRLHVRRRPQHGRALPLERDAGRPREPRRSCSPSATPTGTTTAATSRSARTAACTRRSATAARAATPRTAPRTCGSLFGKLLRLDVSRPRRALEDRRARAAQPVAVLVRPRDRRPVPRRRRPGSDRGDRLHAAREPRPRELRLGPVRGLAALRGRQPRRRGSSSSRSFEYGHDAGLHASPAVTCIAAGLARRERGRYFFGDYCSGTSGACVSTVGRGAGRAHGSRSGSRA